MQFTEKNLIKEAINRKRICALDVGRKRIGVAIVDELHIAISTRETILTTEKIWFDSIMNILHTENIGVVVLGFPVRSDGADLPIHNKILKLEKRIKSTLNIPIFFQDESFTSKRAVQTMVEVGKKKKDRRVKENVDAFAAATILKDFLEEVSW